VAADPLLGEPVAGRGVDERQAEVERALEEARRLGLGRQRVRDSVVGRTVVTGRRLKPIVDELFEEFWSGEPADDDDGLPASEEVVQ
jgi:hypothetical protein